MAGDDAQPPDEKAGFDDLMSDLGEASTFDWDDDELETDEEEETRPVVSFRVGSDLFAIAGNTVREIMGSTEITALPGAPGHINGITVVRRQVVGLFSLRKFLGLNSAPSSRIAASNGQQGGGGEGAGSDLSTERTLIIETAHYTVGIRVDEVTGLSEWPESLLDAETLPDNIRDRTRSYARGARQDNDTLCVYLDLESLLDDAAA